VQIVWAGKVISVRWLLVRVVQIFWVVQMRWAGKVILVRITGKVILVRITSCAHDFGGNLSIGANRKVGADGSTFLLRPIEWWVQMVQTV
jgi:hypothetical protein